MLESLTAVAVIILTVEAMLCTLIPLALTVGVAYVLVRTRQFLPPKLRLARLQARRVSEAVDKTGAQITGSLGAAEAKYVQTESLLRTLFRPSKKD